MCLYRLREVKKKKYDWYGCVIKPVLKVLPSIAMIVAFTFVILIISYKYVATNEDVITYDNEINAPIQQTDVTNATESNYKAELETENIVEVAEPKPIQKVIESVPLDAYFQSWLKGECDKQGVDFYIVMSIIYHESRYETDVTNESTGCMGLMQLYPLYHQRYSSNGEPLNMYAPCVNCLEGIETLKEFSDQADGNIITALTNYSGGSIDYAYSVIDYAERLRAE